MEEEMIMESWIGVGDMEKNVVAMAYGGGEWNVAGMGKKKINFYKAPPKLRYLQKYLIILSFI